MATFRPVAGLAAAAALILAGCSGSSGGADDPRVAPAESAATTPAPATTSAGQSAAPTTPASGAAPAGAMVEPGAEVTGSDWITYEYIGLEDQRAVITARIASITPATSGQVDFLVGEIPNLAGMNVSLIVLEQRKVSGDEVAFESDYGDFKVATGAGKRAQSVTAIGWDECKSSSFTKDFDTAGATIASCFIGAAAPAGDAITGLLYTGTSHADDNPYDSVDGDPVFLNFAG